MEACALCWKRWAWVHYGRAEGERLRAIGRHWGTFEEEESLEGQQDVDRMGRQEQGQKWSEWKMAAAGLFAMHLGRQFGRKAVLTWWSSWWAQTGRFWGQVSHDRLPLSWRGIQSMLIAGNIARIRSFHYSLSSSTEWPLHHPVSWNLSLHGGHYLDQPSPMT